jgi:hypothetical protein
MGKLLKFKDLLFGLGLRRNGMRCYFVVGLATCNLP